MHEINTRERLTQITDAGLFEELATAVLREDDAACRRFAHVGVNDQGKTVKSPVDGIVYGSIDGRRHMLAVHHTTCRPADLRAKWLSDPNSDLKKTLSELRMQRAVVPDLEATLILTTNREPKVELVHDVENAAHKAGVEIRIWSSSALAHFLDFDPKGQWIRKTFLGVDVTHLSREALIELSTRSADSAPLVDDPDLWVNRNADETLRNHAESRVQFILGESGVGKTVACLKCLRQHIQAGGFGLWVTDEVARKSLTVEDAVERTLLNLQPTLAPGAGKQALSLTAENEELLLVIEDINRSAQPARLVELLTSWGMRAELDKDTRSWRIMCPAWPRTLAMARNEAAEAANKSAVLVEPFTKSEGVAAVKRRRQGVTELEAESLASALDYDPLLIALHGDNETTPNPRTTVHSYIERTLERLVTSPGTFTAGEYRECLQKLSLEMLKHRQLEPRLVDVIQWTITEPTVEKMLRQLLKIGDVIRLQGATASQRVAFRHDRVRDHQFAETISARLAGDNLPTSVIAEPYFAEVIGLALANGGVTSSDIYKVAAVNPLSIFCALRHCSSLQDESAKHIVKASLEWAHGDASSDPLNETLCVAVLRTLSECDGPHVKKLCKAIGGDKFSEWSLRGRFRNGDVGAGVQLCAMLPPGVGREGHVELIDHVASKHGSQLCLAIQTILRRDDLTETGRQGTLRLAGFVASPELTEVLCESWQKDPARTQLLSDYFWAACQCCGEDPVTILEPIVDAWAAMSDEEEDVLGSPRVRFGAHELRFAFRERSPERAIAYLVERGQDPELRRPMMVLLDGIDNPDAIEFMVRELAQYDERLEATGHFSPFMDLAVQEWSRRQSSPWSNGQTSKYRGSPMSTVSRERLRDLWSRDTSGKHLRRRALRFWCATVAAGDLPTLRTLDANGEIENYALFERLRRRDRTAIPALAKKLSGEHQNYWWQAGRYLWTAELTECLDRALAQRADDLAESEGAQEDDVDWILLERLTELPPRTAERLLTHHWNGLRHSAYYIKAALHVASPVLLKKVAQVVATTDEPKSLFEYLGINFGIRITGRKGLTRVEQRDGLLPYLEYLSDTDIQMLWWACNKNGWFEWRRDHLDSRAKGLGVRFLNDEAAVKELDRNLGSEDSLFFLHHWGKDFLETGVSNEHMLDVIARWVSDREQNRALVITAELVTRFGNRRHLDLLRQHNAAETQLGNQVIRNAEFELCLRSLD